MDQYRISRAVDFLAYREKCSVKQASEKIETLVGLLHILLGPEKAAPRRRPGAKLVEVVTPRRRDAR